MKCSTSKQKLATGLDHYRLDTVVSGTHYIQRTICVLHCNWVRRTRVTAEVAGEVQTFLRMGLN